MNPFLTLFTLPLILVTIVSGEMYDPFAQTQTMKKTYSAPPLLMPLPPIVPAKVFVPTVVTAVMNDKAFINGRWYNVNDSINNQLITSIQPHFVTLKEGNRLIILGVGTQRLILRTKETQ